MLSLAPPIIAQVSTVCRSKSFLRHFQSKRHGTLSRMCSQRFTIYNVYRIYRQTETVKGKFDAFVKLVVTTVPDLRTGRFVLFSCAIRTLRQVLDATSQMRDTLSEIVPVRLPTLTPPNSQFFSHPSLFIVPLPPPPSL